MYSNDNYLKSPRNQQSYSYNRYRNRRNVYSRDFPPHFKHRCPWSPPKGEALFGSPYRNRNSHHLQTQHHLPPPPPLRGTEEYTMKQIQETSNMIKRQLMMPDMGQNKNENIPSIKGINHRDSIKILKKNNKNGESVKNLKPFSPKTQQNPKIPPLIYNVEEIHNKIINHLTNMSHGKKKNLIDSGSKGYDIAIQQIQKQKRLELSRALREMCTSKSVQNNEYIDTIIPDIGIELRDLPFEVIENLSKTFNLEFEDDCQPVTIKKEIIDENPHEIDITEHDVEIKREFKVEFDPKEFDVPPTYIECIDNVNSIDDLPKNTEEVPMECPVVQNTEEVPVECPVVQNTEEVPVECPVVQNTEKVPVECLQQGILYCILLEDTENESKNDKQEENTLSTESTDSKNKMETKETQTITPKKSFENVKPKTIKGAIKIMKEIDDEIERLTKIRQNIFMELYNENSNRKNAKKRKRSSLEKNNSDEGQEEKNETTLELDKGELLCKENSSEEKEKIEEQKEENKANLELGKYSNLSDKEEFYYKEGLVFNIKEKILLIKVFRDQLLAGSESGKIFILNLKDGSLESTINVSNLPITNFAFEDNSMVIAVGSKVFTVKGYDMKKKAVTFCCDTPSNISCVECNWSFYFLGTNNGSLLRISSSTNRIVFEEIISPEKKILSLKTLNEGVRKVLLTNSQSMPLCIRDAFTGLCLRTIESNPTNPIYSIREFLTDKGLVYSTCPFRIYVNDFNDGSLRHCFNITSAYCLKIKGNLLFAAIGSGHIIIYHTVKKKEIARLLLKGRILNMDFISNMLIIVTQNGSLGTILIPEDILRQALAS